MHYGTTRDRSGNKFGEYVGVDLEFDFMELWKCGHDACWGPTGDPVTHWRPLPAPPSIKPEWPRVINRAEGKNHATSSSEGEGAMSDEEKLMALFTKIHGEITGSCYTEIIYDEDHKVFAVDVMKDGNLCWRATKVDLLFDIIDTTFPTSIAQKMREKFEIEI